MTISRIPLVQDNPHFIQQSLLDGRTYTLEFEWNEREESWYLRVADAENITISANHKLVPNWPMLNRVVTENKPPGELFIIDLTGKGIPPGLDELDERIILEYFDEEEMEAYR